MIPSKIKPRGKNMDKRTLKLMEYAAWVMGAIVIAIAIYGVISTLTWSQNTRQTIKPEVITHMTKLTTGKIISWIAIILGLIVIILVLYKIIIGSQIPKTNFITN